MHGNVQNFILILLFIVFLFFFQSNIPEIHQDQIAEIEEEYFPDESPYGLFRTCRWPLKFLVN